MFSSSLIASLPLPYHRLLAYPKERYPSPDQMYLMLVKKQHIDESEYKDWSFPSSFFTKYGECFRHFRAFERAMRVEANPAIIIKYKNQIDFVELATTYSFIDFCRKSDRLAVQKRYAPMGRAELESAWIQELFYKFDAMDLETIKRKYGWGEDAQSRVHLLLKKAIDKRFDTEGVEEYWVEKKKRFPKHDFDIEKLGDDVDVPFVEKKKAAGEYVETSEGDVDAGEVVLKNDPIFGPPSPEQDNEMSVGDVMDVDDDLSALAYRPRH